MVELAIACHLTTLGCAFATRTGEPLSQAGTEPKAAGNAGLCDEDVAPIVSPHWHDETEEV